MDHNQQMEVLRLESPEQLGGERFGRVVMAVENVLNATASVDTLSEEHYAIAGAAIASQAEKSLQDTVMLNQAEAIVDAEAKRIETGRQNRDTHDQIEQIRADVNAAMPTSFKDNPLFKVDA